MDCQLKGEAMSQRDPYDSSRPCPKCGFGDTTTTFCPGVVPRCRRHPFEDGEHLDRHCRRCGYAWAEDCLNIEQRSLLPQEQFAKVRLAERDRCAQIAESYGHTCSCHIAEDIAALVRMDALK